MSVDNIEVVNLEVMEESNRQPNNENTEQESEGVSEQNKKTDQVPRRKEKQQKTPKVSENSSRKRKNASPWWDHYKKIDDSDSAECLYCHKLIGCSTTNGTTSLANHIKRCKMLPANLDKKQKILNFETQIITNRDGRTETISVSRPWLFNQEVARSALAKMLIVDELPFMFVEREGFRSFCKSMHPEFVIPSRFTAARDCYNLFIEEKRKLNEFFKKLSSRICLTTDSWTSGQNLSYMCLTAHFIDDNWNLHKKVINFCPVAGHSGQLIGRAVEKCLNEWKIKNIMTVTVDNASSNDLAIDYLRKRFNHWECGVLDGKFLHMRCASHILNLVVKDGLRDLSVPILKARTFVKYVRSCPARLQKFKTSVEEEKLDSKSLVCLDVETRWNSTYLMLESALKFKKAFENLIMKDSTFRKEMRKVGGDITSDEWKQVSSFLPFLKVFYDATLKLSGSLYVTSNYYVDAIFGVGYVLFQHLSHEDRTIRQMASQMKLKYDKYWGNIDKLNLYLFISVILDPRRKMAYVEWMVKAWFGIERATHLTLSIRSTFSSLFEFYNCSLPISKNMQEPSSSSSTSASSFHHKDKERDGMFDFSEFLGSTFEIEVGGGTSEKKIEWEKYLEDERESNESCPNVLHWWKDNKKRYPTLAKMARDILAIPVSTVASESAFSTGGRVLDSFRTSLTPRMVEALICAQDWLRTSNDPFIIEESLLEMEKFEEGMQDLTVEQPMIVIDEAIDDISND